MKKMNFVPVTMRDFLDGKCQADFVAALSDEAPGAIPNGTKICKANTKLGDVTQDGALGIIMGSIGPLPFEGHPTYGYFVRWDHSPHVPCFITGTRIKPIGPS